MVNLWKGGEAAVGRGSDDQQARGTSVLWKRTLRHVVVGTDQCLWRHPVLGDLAKSNRNFCTSVLPRQFLIIAFSINTVCEGKSSSLPDFPFYGRSFPLDLSAPRSRLLHIPAPLLICLSLSAFAGYPALGAISLPGQQHCGRDGAGPASPLVLRRDLTCPQAKV